MIKRLDKCSLETSGKEANKPNSKEMYSPDCDSRIVNQNLSQQELPALKPKWYKDESLKQ